MKATDLETQHVDRARLNTFSHQSNPLNVSERLVVDVRIWSQTMKTFQRLPRNLLKSAKSETL